MHARGFTLVELLVALLVTALLGLMSWRGLDGMATALQRTRTRTDEVQVLQNGLQQWGTDLDAMATQPTSAIDWDGKVLRITRTAPAGATPGLQVVAWTLQSKAGVQQWVRWQSPALQTNGDLRKALALATSWAQGAQLDTQSQEVALVPVQDWRIYYYRTDGWSNALSSAEAGNVRPDGVRLELDLAPGKALSGKITRDWVRATYVSNRS